jgi:hypothetical protein
MKRLVTLASAVAMGIALAAPAKAQEGGPAGMAPPTEYGEHHGYVRDFDRYLDRHPDVAKQLSANPHLIDNQQYLSQHPELREWMQRHPRAADAFRDHPDRFMHREHLYNRSEAGWEERHGEGPGGMTPPTEYGEHHGYVRDFDGYLDRHPDVAKQLSANPHLIDNQQYLSQHPELREWMQRHPRAADAFRDHPDRFMHREHLYNRSETRWDRAHHRADAN